MSFYDDEKAHIGQERIDDLALKSIQESMKKMNDRAKELSIKLVGIEDSCSYLQKMLNTLLYYAVKIENLLKIEQEIKEK